MSFLSFIRRIAPSALGMIALSCYILVDTFFVSLALGASGLAALNLSIAVFSAVSGVGQMIGVGGGTDFALRCGEEKDPGAAFSAALRYGAYVSLVFMLIGLLFSRRLALFLGADDATLAMTHVYIRMTLLFAPCHIFNAILQAFVRNDHEPRLAMISMLISSGANIALDYVFMFPLGMGMFGAVLATGLSALLSILALLTHFMRNASTLRPSRRRVSPHEMLRLLSYGLSALIGELASAISLMTFNLILMRIGGYIAVAAYGVIANAALVAAAIFTGVGQGLQPLASHAFGADDTAALHILRRHAQRTALLAGAAIFALVFLLAAPIASIFNHEGSAELHAIAVSGLRLYFSGYLFAGMNIIAAALLSAAAQPERALVLSLLRSCVLLIPASLLLSAALSIRGVWLAFSATEAVVCMLSLRFMRRLR